MYTSLVSLFTLFLLTISCGPKKMSRTGMYELAKKNDPNMKIVMPKDIKAGIKCSDYGPGCVGGKTVLIRNVEMIAVEFESTEFAKKWAYKVDTYYAVNWLFDDVVGEPVLERFIQEVYDAKRPRLEETKQEEKGKESNPN